MFAPEELDFRLVFEDDGRQDADPELDVRTGSRRVPEPVGHEPQAHLPGLTAAGSYQHVAYQALGPEYGAREDPGAFDPGPRYIQESRGNPRTFDPGPQYIQESRGNPRTFDPGPQYIQESRGNPRTFDTGPHYAAPGNPGPLFACPSIQITSIAPNSHAEAGGGSGGLDAPGAGGAEGGYPEEPWSRDQLYLPLDPCYRDPVLSLSPCSSLSSRSWMSDLSSGESFNHFYDDLEGELGDTVHLALGSPGCGGGGFGVELWQQKYQHPSAFSPALSPHLSPHQSPNHSPRASVTEESWLGSAPSRPSSRPPSPCGKRRHSGADARARSPSPLRSPSPTPGTSPRGSVTDDTWTGSPGGARGLLLMSGFQETDVPSKTRRTSGFPAGRDPLSEELKAGVLFQDAPGKDSRPRDDAAELFLQVPSRFSWNKPKPGNAPLFRTSSPPPLDAPLPGLFEDLELKLEIQPKFYHRAHYETEGSRGAIKAASGGHPVVRLIGYSQQALGLLLFIGTADERCLRPHSFYQVHRVTGKTVTTACLERVLENTKVLEIPLLPENNMSASIDCAGILKLRNADIELKKGETDVGRKNTRVRVAFRVGVPQADGRALWLQTATVPIECSQRSGQDLPQVSTFSPLSSSADGGDELTILGSNMSPQSRVFFSQRGSDGRSLWETEARVLPERSGASTLVVLVPPYGKNPRVPVQVEFCVSNGKRKKSAVQTFSFLPGPGSLLHGGVKQEPDPLALLSCFDPPVTRIHLRGPLSVPSQLGPSPRPGAALAIKQEPEDPRGPDPSGPDPSGPDPHGLQITLDDVNEIIDRDISLRTVLPPRRDQDAPAAWAPR